MTNQKTGFSSEVSREISFPALLMMSLGSTIGGGIFLAVYYNRAMGQSLMTLFTAFSICGLLAVCTAMSYAEMNSALPGADGIHDFTKKLFGLKFGGFIAWCEWLLLCAAGAMNAGIIGTIIWNLLSEAGFFMYEQNGLILARLLAALLVFGFVWKVS